MQNEPLEVTIQVTRVMACVPNLLATFSPALWQFLGCV